MKNNFFASFFVLIQLLPKFRMPDTNLNGFDKNTYSPTEILS